MWVWSPRGEDAKNKTMKISSKGLTSNSVKICTSENFQLYSTWEKKYIDACDYVAM